MAGHIQARAAVTGRRGGRHVSRGRRCGWGQRPAPHRPASAPEPGSTPQHCTPATQRGAQVLCLRADRLSQARPQENRARCPRLRAARNAQGTPRATCLKGLTQTELSGQLWVLGGTALSRCPPGTGSLSVRGSCGGQQRHSAASPAKTAEPPGGQAGSWTLSHGRQAPHGEGTTHLTQLLRSSLS